MKTYKTSDGILLPHPFQYHDQYDGQQLTTLDALELHTQQLKTNINHLQNIDRDDQAEDDYQADLIDLRAAEANLDALINEYHLNLTNNHEPVASNKAMARLTGIVLWTPDQQAPTTPDDGDAFGIRFLDLTQVLTGDFTDDEYLIPPIIPKGRQTAIYAEGKAGKSLLTLDLVCALASGRPLLGQQPEPPVHILYIDFEMTPADLQERLSDLGYTYKDPDWPQLTQHLHYAQLQPWYALDSDKGGQQMENICNHYNIQLVVIDTLIRSVEGEENTSDTIKDFNRHTGQRLKSKGITLVRIDHAGKDSSKGQRGSSAKRDDVDLIWRLKPTGTEDDGAIALTLRNDACRMSWVPQEVYVTRHTDPYLKHTIPQIQISDPAATLWHELKDAGLPRGSTKHAARKFMTEHDIKGSNAHLGEALRWWKEQPE